MNCKKCNKQLEGRQLSYCSRRCSKNHLNSLYRKRNRDRVNAYKRDYNKRGLRASGWYEKEIRPRILEQEKVCARCGSVERLNVHHIKPLQHGGTHHRSNLMVLCWDCHMLWHKKLNGYWEVEGKAA